MGIEKISIKLLLFLSCGLLIHGHYPNTIYELSSSVDDDYDDDDNDGFANDQPVNNEILQEHLYNFKSKVLNGDHVSSLKDHNFTWSKTDPKRLMNSAKKNEIISIIKDKQTTDWISSNGGMQSDQPPAPGAPEKQTPKTPIDVQALNKNHYQLQTPVLSINPPYNVDSGVIIINETDSLTPLYPANIKPPSSSSSGWSFWNFLSPQPKPQPQSQLKAETSPTLQSHQPPLNPQPSTPSPQPQPQPPAVQQKQQVYRYPVQNQPPQQQYPLRNVHNQYPSYPNSLNLQQQQQQQQQQPQPQPQPQPQLPYPYPNPFGWICRMAANYNCSITNDPQTGPMFSLNRLLNKPPNITNDYCLMLDTSNVPANKIGARLITPYVALNRALRGCLRLKYSIFGDEIDKIIIYQQDTDNHCIYSSGFLESKDKPREVALELSLDYQNNSDPRFFIEVYMKRLTTRQSNFALCEMVITHNALCSKDQKNNCAPAANRLMP